MHPFITGSHAYGEPTSESDIDLVIPPMFLSGDEATVRLFSDSGDVPIKYNKLNLLIAPTEEAFWLWWKCTVELKNRKPVTREFAIEYIESAFKSAGIERFLSNSGD